MPRISHSEMKGLAQLKRHWDPTWDPTLRRRQQEIENKRLQKEQEARDIGYMIFKKNEFLKQERQIEKKQKIEQQAEIKSIKAHLCKQEIQIKKNAAEIAEQYLEVRYWEEKVAKQKRDQKLSKQKTQYWVANNKV